jgi:ABC-type molybdate transport system substrate-binding protein
MNITTIQAQNPAENISISNALQFNNYLDELGLGLTNIYAEQPNNQGPAGQYTLLQLQQLGIDPTVPIFLWGMYTAVAGKAVGQAKATNIALMPALITGAPGLTSYLRLFENLNSGSATVDAENALLNASVSTDLLTELTSLKAEYGVA